jgi:hypothetical protein
MQVAAVGVERRCVMAQLHLLHDPTLKTGGSKPRRKYDALPGCVGVASRLVGAGLVEGRDQHAGLVG